MLQRIEKSEIKRKSPYEDPVPGKLYRMRKSYYDNNPSALIFWMGEPREKFEDEYQKLSDRPIIMLIKQQRIFGVDFDEQRWYVFLWQEELVSKGVRPREFWDVFEEAQTQ